MTYRNRKNSINAVIWGYNETRNRTMLENFYSILLIFGLILLNASFVAAEFSIARVRKTHIDQIVDSANNDNRDYSENQIKAAKVLQKMILNINDYISACQVGITIASLALGAVAEAKIEKWITPIIEQMHLPIDEHIVSIILALSIITFFHVILGEVVPKNIAIINAEATSLNLVYFLQSLHWLFKLPVHLLNASSNLVLGLLGIEVNFTDTAHSEAELKMILSSSQAQGVLEAEEEQLIQNVFQFNDTIARDVMVPRSDMICLNDKLTIAEASHETNKTTHTRFPIYHEKIDNIVGYISIKDILKAYEKNETDNNIKSIANDPLKVTDGMYVIDLIKLMQENKKPMAILIDEFGGVTGLLTVEDIVEEIFGEIDDEDEEQTHEVQELANGDYLVDGLTNLEDVNEVLGSNFNSDHFDTIGGLIFGEIGTEPKIGDELEIDGYKLRVEKHGKNRVREVKISKA